MKIQLIFPPDWYTVRPHHCIPYLSALLKQKGHEVTVRDLNIEAFDTLVSDNYILDSWKDMDCMLDAGKNQTEFKKHLRMNIGLAEQIHGEVDRAKVFLRNTADFMEALHYEGIIFQARRVISARHYHSEMPFEKKGWIRHRNDFDKVIEDINDRKSNLYYEYFEKVAVPGILRHKTNFIGINVESAAQVVPALTLSRLLKQSAQGVYIALFGSYVKHLNSCITTRNYGEQVACLFDFLVVDDDYRAFFMLLEKLYSPNSSEIVQSAVLNKGYPMAVEKVQKPPEDFHFICPDFSGFRWELYLSPNKIVPLLCSAGNYMNPQNLKMDSGFFVEVLKNLKNELNTPYFTLCDKFIDSENLKQISEKIIESGLDIIWNATCKFDSGFTREILVAASDAGLRIISCDMNEKTSSISQVMKNTYSNNSTRDIIKDCWNSKIWVNIRFDAQLLLKTSEDAGERISEEDTWVNPLLPEMVQDLYFSDYGLFESTDDRITSLLNESGDIIYPFGKGRIQDSVEILKLLKDNLFKQFPHSGFTKFSFHDVSRLLIALNYWDLDSMIETIIQNQYDKNTKYNYLNNLNAYVCASFWNRDFKCNGDIYIFNSQNGKLVKLGSDGDILIELIQQEIHLKDLLRRFSEVKGLRWENAEETVKKYLGYFLVNDFITVSEEKMFAMYY